MYNMLQKPGEKEEEKKIQLKSKTLLHFPYHHIKHLPDMIYPVIPYIFAVQFVVNILDLSNRIVVPMKQ